VPAHTLQSNHFVFESAEAGFVGLDDVAEWTFRDGMLSGPSPLRSEQTSVALAQARVTRRSDGGYVRATVCVLDGTVSANEMLVTLDDHRAVTIVLDPPLADDDAPLDVWVAIPDRSLGMKFGDTSLGSPRSTATVIVPAGPCMIGSRDSARTKVEFPDGVAEVRVTIRRATSVTPPGAGDSRASR
jgi:hypothetical protein